LVRYYKSSQTMLRSSCAKSRQQNYYNVVSSYSMPLVVMWCTCP